VLERVMAIWGMRLASGNPYQTWAGSKFPRRPGTSPGLSSWFHLPRVVKENGEKFLQAQFHATKSEIGSGEISKNTGLEREQQSIASSLNWAVYI
jgi:hypothetical protein